jgi:phage terminase small subunit
MGNARTAAPEAGTRQAPAGQAQQGGKAPHCTHNPIEAGSMPPATTRTLNRKQRAFVAEYMIDKNATQAAIRAGYSKATAKQIGSRLLTNVDVSTAVDQQQDQHIARVVAVTGISLERIVREVARGAFHDPRKFFDGNGNLKPIPELDDDTAAALAGFDVTVEFAGSGREREAVGFTKKVKLADRKGYLDMLMKHLGGYKKDNEQTQQPLAEALRGFIGELHQAGSRLPFAPKGGE